MPVLLTLAVPFFAFAAAIVLMGLSQTHTAQHGSGTSTGFWQFLSGGVLKLLFGAAAKAGRFVVSHFAAAQLHLLAKWLVGMGTLTLGWFGVNPAFAEAIVHALERVMHRGDPRARAKATTANAHAVHAGRAASHANAHARSVGHHLTRYRAHTDTRLHHLTHQTTVALPRDIANVKHRERWAERQIWKVRDRAKALEDGAIKTWEWITDHPAGAAAAAFTGALAAVLSWPAIRALRCNEFGNLFNKRGCGLWNDLEGLLGLATAVLAFSDLEELLKTAEAIEGDVITLAKDALNIG